MRIVLTVIFVLVSIALSVIVLAQQGADGRAWSDQVASATATGARTSQDQWKGKLVQVTRILAVVFVVLAVVLNLNFLGDGGSMQQSTGPFSFMYRFRQNEGEKIGY
ncbi:MAG: preprotein translocase subunit SecG [Lachnospiraceae bacterium]